MNHFDLEKQLKDEGKQERHLPEDIRARLEETYSKVLQQGMNETFSQAESRKPRKKRLFPAISAAAVLGLGVFASTVQAF